MLKASLRAKIPRSLKNRLKDSKLNYLRLWLTECRVRLFPPRYFGQTAEDVILKWYLPETNGFYLDVGAGRPIAGSNTFALYLRGWTGICIDPISTNARLLKSFRRKDEVLNILIGPNKSTLDFWEFEPYEYSTADESVAEKVKKNAGIRLLNYSKKAIKPLSAIAPELSPLDAALLSIDVEGFDLEVLKSNDWSVFIPRVICIEEWEETMDKHSSSTIGDFLANHNYKRVAWTGLSSIFVEESYLESMSKL
ncbi:MAG: FkbM family methyltransferase [Actinomycetota bacterium]|nr:FkbM family methyltransferase [Actinomycetota bacterium]